MRTFLRDCVHSFTSLRLTVVLLVLSMILVFIATLAQVNLGVWAVQTRYFRSLFVMAPVRGSSLWVPIFPGGYLIGGLLLVNLAAVLVRRFGFAWRHAGLWLAHSGLVLLLLGEFLSGLMQRESLMRLDQGETKAYSESSMRYELAVVDATNPQFDDVVAIPAEVLDKLGPIQNPKLPFRVQATLYYPNSDVRMRSQVQNPPSVAADQGFGATLAVLPLPVTYRPDERNLPSALVRLDGPEGPIGTWLISSLLTEAQTISFQGRTFELRMRPVRYYQPFTLTLLKFSHDRYPGTDIPKNFSSRVRLRTDDGGADREVLIYMNNPLRHGGLTFYQAGFENSDRTSVFQVVRNPSWLLPYISCVLMGLGLTIHFGIHLTGFLRRRSAASAASSAVQAAPAGPWWKRHLALIVFVLGALWLASTLVPPATKSEFDLPAFGRLPALADGRVKPLDTVARNSLLMLQGRQRFVAPDHATLQPVEWLLDVFFNPALADNYSHFLIENPEVLALFGEKSEGQKRFSFNELRSGLPELDRQMRLAEPVDEAVRTPFQREVVRLYQRLLLYQRLKSAANLEDSPDFLAEVLRLQEQLPAVSASLAAKAAGRPAEEAAAKVGSDYLARFQAMAEQTSFLLVPPAGRADSHGWRKEGDALAEGLRAGAISPDAMALAGLAHAWRLKQPKEFNEVLRLYSGELAERFPSQLRRCAVEVAFNRAQPFYTSMIVYVLAGLLAAISWLRWPEALPRSAFGLLALAFLATTAGILARMWLEGRPPVTNLYSSALFVGWAAVALCLIIEWLYRNSIGAVAGGMIGFGTLLIAHHLALGGDTLEMMRAVLDSNFWLATHVVVITMGYGATFLAGFLALVYLLRGVLTRTLEQPTADALTRMVYGIVCFATLFSLVGTVLGGIWADQSWGRFWGWDPKENGALIIVLWNAVILHCRWGGIVRQRGLMMLAVFGNIVTAWSWFGVNMLGVGLHSYGFMQSAFYGLIAFVASQLAVILLGALPLPLWRSGAGLQR